MNKVSKFEGRAKSGYHVTKLWDEYPEASNKLEDCQSKDNSRRCAFCFSKGNETHGDARLRYAEQNIVIVFVINKNIG